MLHAASDEGRAGPTDTHTASPNTSPELDWQATDRCCSPDVDPQPMAVLVAVQSDHGPTAQDARDDGHGMRLQGRTEVGLGVCKK